MHFVLFTNDETLNFWGSNKRECLENCCGWKTKCNWGKKKLSSWPSYHQRNIKLLSSGCKL